MRCWFDSRSLPLNVRAVVVEQMIGTCGLLTPVLPDVWNRANTWSRSAKCTLTLDSDQIRMVPAEAAALTETGWTKVRTKQLVGNSKEIVFHEAAYLCALTLFGWPHQHLQTDGVYCTHYCEDCWIILDSFSKLTLWTQFPSLTFPHAKT